MTGQRLPQAYRSRPRPSSALSAKASTVCPCSLDQKNTGIDVAMEFSRCTRTTPHYRDAVPLPLSDRARSLKTQQRTYGTVEVNVYLGELSGLTISGS
jgi:GTP cyclohydrolase FolE2